MLDALLLEELLRILGGRHLAGVQAGDLVRQAAEGVRQHAGLVSRDRPSCNMCVCVCEAGTSTTVINVTNTAVYR